MSSNNKIGLRQFRSVSRLQWETHSLLMCVCECVCVCQEWQNSIQKFFFWKMREWINLYAMNVCICAHRIYPTILTVSKQSSTVVILNSLFTNIVVGVIVVWYRFPVFFNWNVALLSLLFFFICRYISVCGRKSHRFQTHIWHKSNIKCNKRWYFLLLLSCFECNTRSHSI